MILAILQARASSSRLPQKVLKPILGVPMVLRQAERIKQSKKIDQLLLATSTDPQDQAIQDHCKLVNLECFRGNLNDVLDRFYQAAKPWKPDHVVRLTGDCPLVDPTLIDEIIQFHLNGKFDYTSNSLNPTFPDGLDCEVIRASALEIAWKEATLKTEREHVTPFFYQHPKRFKIGDFQSPENYSHLRWTVDEADDFKLITEIYKSLYPHNPNFRFQDILNLIETRPELKTWNTSHKRNEGYAKTLAEEQAKESHEKKIH